VIHSSNTPISARTSVCRNRTGPPSSRTTRMPHASLPIDRPRDSVSMVTGRPTTTVATAREMTITTRSWLIVAAWEIQTPDRIRTSVTTAARIRKSSIAPIARVMNDAGRASSTTPSPMTMPSCTVPPVGV
jgi:hypothetical protein